MRAIWLILVILAFTSWVVGTIENSTSIPAACPGGTCDPFALSTGDLAALADLNLPVRAIAGFFVASNIFIALAFFIIGGALAWRKSTDWMGLLVSFTLVSLGAVFFTDSDDALWRAYPASRTLLLLLSTVSYAAIMLLLFYFPDGRFVPRGKTTRLIGWLIILVTAPFVGTATRVGAVGTLPMALTIGLGFGAQVYRYLKISGRVQRQQTKWVVFGLATSLLVMLLWVFASITYPPGPSSLERVQFLLFTRPLISVVIPLLPLTIALSIMRYRLWDLDLVINRTLVYSLLTGLLALIYFGSVVLLQQLLPAESPLATVISTLGIVILFNPLRRRIQNNIDRRFFRQKYNARHTLAAFGTTVRNEMELERLTAELVGVVDETMQPEHVSLWLKQ